MRYPSPLLSSLLNIALYTDRFGIFQVADFTGDELSMAILSGNFITNLIIFNIMCLLLLVKYKIVS